MSKLVVTPVLTKKDQKQFLDLALKLYAGDANWVPPLWGEHKRLLNFKHHPFYDDGKIRTFLASRNGEVVGRIGAIVNNGHNRKYKESRGFCGFFESVDDQEVADGLFNAACSWLVEQGMTKVRGPVNPSLNYECGLLVDGFHSPPTFLMTYNKPYYGKLFDQAGFEKVQDLYAFWGHIDMLSGLNNKLAFIINESKERFNIKVRPLNKKHFLAEVEMFLGLYNASMASHWGFVPLSPGEIKELAKGLKMLLAPELVLIAEVDGVPIGVCLGLLDYNPRIKSIGGRLFPFGFIKLLRNKRSIKKLKVLSINVVPEYQAWGAGVVLMAGLLEPVQKWGMLEAEFSWVAESNSLSRGGLEKGGAKLDKTYRIYDRDLV